RFFEDTWQGWIVSGGGSRLHADWHLCHGRSLQAWSMEVCRTAASAWIQRRIRPGVGGERASCARHHVLDVSSGLEEGEDLGSISTKWQREVCLHLCNRQRLR